MQISRRHYPYLLAAGMGLAFSLSARAGLMRDSLPDSGWPSISFLLVLFICLGAVTAHFTPEASRARAGNAGWRLCWAPFTVVLTFSFAALLFHLQAFLGVLLLFPAFFMPATAGAHVYASIADLLRPGSVPP